MKGTKLMRIVALLMAMLMLFSATACTDGGSDSKKKTGSNKNNAEASDDGYDEGEYENAVEIIEDQSVLEDENLRYVMIYNPRIYDENARTDKTVLKTGYLGNQVEVGAYRADGLDDEAKPIYTLPQNFFEPLPEDFELEQSRADAMGVEHSVGEIMSFKTVDFSQGTRVDMDYVCVYEGQYCYIWSLGTLTAADVKSLADEFDTKIYKEVTENFGPARFDSSAGGNGKINLVFTVAPDGLLGYHYQYDVFASGELRARDEAYCQPIYDHDILFVNQDCIGSYYYSEKEVCSTLAHEFQHLVMATAALSTAKTTYCRSWMNEAMSGYVEDEIYPGIQTEAMRPEAFMQSNLIRNGQSLYNFTTKEGFYSNDIGVYGSVYVFSEYLADLAGDDVFSNFHKYWRESYSRTLCESEALVNSVPASVKSQIDKSIVYPESITFANDNDEWMSKLTLDFYLSMLAKEGNLDAYQPISNDYLLYDEINGANIEGGGRIIVAVDGKFEIPEDADSGLIYVGLDKNYQPVTSFVYK